MTKCFEILKNSKDSKARIGIFKTSHGEITTPVFMPVATQGTVKTISNTELHKIGVEIFVANTYHLYLRPGIQIIKKAQGLHKFINWNKSILTDSGGFQIYSLATLRKITDEAVEFQSHLDGSSHFFTPEKVIELQYEFGSDIIMCLDECNSYPCTYDYAKVSLERTIRWAKRCKEKFIQLYENSENKKQLLFGIIQGSTYLDLRKESTLKTLEIDFDGYAIGGLAVGEPKEVTLEIVKEISPMLPENKIRYAMGVGTPEEIWQFVEQGIDMFDCVIPTRNGRNGQALTSIGKLNIKNSEFRDDFAPLDPSCNCPVCKEYSRAYIHHLFHAGELLSLRLLTLHNLFFMLKLLKLIKDSIKTGTFLKEKKNFLEKYCNNKNDK